MGVLNTSLLGKYLEALARTGAGETLSLRQAIGQFRQKQQGIAGMPDKSRKKRLVECPSCGSSFYVRVDRRRRTQVDLLIQYNAAATPMLFRRTAGRRTHLGDARKLLRDPRQIPDFDKEMPRRWFDLGEVVWQSGILYKDGPSGRKRGVGWDGHKATTGRNGTRRRPAPG